jgi:hypothetical protein
MKVMFRLPARAPSGRGMAAPGGAKRVLPIQGPCQFGDLSFRFICQLVVGHARNFGGGFSAARFRSKGRKLLDYCAAHKNRQRGQKPGMAVLPREE